MLLENHFNFKLSSKHRNQISVFALFLLLVGSGLFVNTALNLSQNDEIDITDISAKGGENYKIRNQLQNDISVPNTAKSNGKQNLLSPYANQFNANIEIENKLSQDGFKFQYNQTYFDNTTYTGLNNDTSFTVSTINERYNELNLNITAYINDNKTIVEDDASASGSLGVSNSIAQGFKIPDLVLNDSIFEISRVNISVTKTSALHTIVGGIWNATFSGGRLQPHFRLGNATINPTGSESELLFNITNPVTLSQSNTYFNSSGGYAFIVIYRTDSDSTFGESTDISFDLHSGDGVDDGTTYSESFIASNNTTWSSVQPLDFTSDILLDILYDPYNLSTFIKPPNPQVDMPLDRNGNYNETLPRLNDILYNIYYNNTIPSGLSPLLNISYFIKETLFNSTNFIRYSTSPSSSRINWTIYFANNYVANGNSTKYFVIPNNFTDIRLYNTAGEIPQSGNYVVQPFNSLNQSVVIDSSRGDNNFTLTASSTNLFQFVNPSTEKFSISWIQSTIATMGVLVTSSTIGDRIRSNVTLISPFNSVSITAGNGLVNASLRTQTGAIHLGGSNGPVGGYNFTATYKWNTSLIFETVLEPNMPVGYYTYQFRWFNGTAAGAIAVEIEIYPVTVIETYSHASEFNALEGDMLNFEMATLDLSRNSNWSTSNQLTSTFETTSLIYNRSESNRYIYSVSLNLSIISNPLVRPGKYLLNFSMTESIYTNFLEMNISIFDRGDTEYELGLNASPNPEFGDDFNFWISPLNATSADLDKRFDSSNLAEFVVLYSNSTNTEDVTSAITIGDYNTTSYNFTIPWNDNFELGSNNQFDVMWNLSDFRETADDAFVHKTFNIIIIDSRAPNVSDLADIQRNEETVVNSPLTWQINDLFLMNYTITRDGVVVGSGSGISGPIDIIYTLPVLSAGIYIYEITVEDENTRVSSDIVTVTVLDIVAPSFTTPSGLNRSLAIGNYSNIISWIANDNNPDFYEIWVNNQFSTAGSWTSGSPILFDISNLQDGIEIKIEIRVNDTSNNINNDIIYLNIDRNAPTILSSGDFRIFDNNKNAQVTWALADSFPSNYAVYKNGTSISSGSWSSATNVTIDLGVLIVGVYNYTIVVFDISGNFASDSVFVNVKPQGIIETDEIEVLEYTDAVYEGDIDEIQGTWTEFLSGNGISGANISVNLYLVTDNLITGDPLSNSFFSFTDQQGTYLLALNYDSVGEGNYRWMIQYTKVNHENQSVVIDVEVLPHTVLIVLTYGDTLTRNEPYIIIAEVKYITFDNSSLQLSSLTFRRSGAVAGVNITFIITYLTLDGNSSQIIQIGTTDNTGFVSITLSAEETSGIQQIQGISAGITDSESITSITMAVSDTNLPNAVDPEFDLNEFIQASVDFITENWEFILIGLLVVIFSISILTSQIKKRRRKIATLNRELENAIEEINGIISIEAIIMKNSETGIPFYYQTFEDEENSLDLSLIASLTTAISTFLSELQEGSSGFETMEREGISLTSHRGESSDFIIISNSPLALSQFEQIQNSHLNIELGYQEDIINPLMIQEISESEVATILINHGLKVDLKGYLKINQDNINKAMNNSSISKSIRQNMDYLYELGESIDQANLPVNLTSILDFLMSKELSPEISARIILVAYDHEIIFRSKDSN